MGLLVTYDLGSLALALGPSLFPFARVPGSREIKPNEENQFLSVVSKLFDRFFPLVDS